MPTNNTATTNTTATPPATNTASGIEAQMRAIRESGWKQAPSAKKQ
jgi:hypothetical protein